MISITVNGTPVVHLLMNGSLQHTSGHVRWNGPLQRLEVCDVNGYWNGIPNNVTIQTSSEFENMYKWYQEKLREEERIKQLAEKYPSVKQAKEHLDILIRITDNG